MLSLSKHVPLFFNSLATCDANVHDIKKASLPWRHKSPERLTLNSSDHFSPSEKRFASFVGPRITPEAFATMGVAFYDGTNITPESSVKKLS